MIDDLNYAKKQVNAILVALDTEIAILRLTRAWLNLIGNTYPEMAAMMMAYYTTRCKFEEDDCNE